MGAPDPFTATSLVGHWVGGQAHAGAGTRRQDVFNPASGRVARQVVLGEAADVATAVAAARAAAPGWAETPPIRRARILNAFLALMNQHKDTLA
ncbi:MAG: aldehyde dehydrogenase family protein, partial [Rubrivivax sp.]